VLLRKNEGRAITTYMSRDPLAIRVIQDQRSVTLHASSKLDLPRSLVLTYKAAILSVHKCLRR